MSDNFSNWADNVRYNAARLHLPSTVEEIQELVSTGTKLKALGSRHSFNRIADCSDDLIALDRLNKIAGIDSERRTVTVEAGVRYAALGDELTRHGFALQNLASLPHITVAGACATATHGSGDLNGNLATSVCALEVVTANGEQKSLSADEDGDIFAGAVVGLGGLGIVTQVTLNLVPEFDVRQDVYENLEMRQVQEHFDEIMSSAYSVSLFTEWRDSRFKQVWRKSVVDSGSEVIATEPEFFGATLGHHKFNPVPGASTDNATEQMGVPGAWNTRLPHFRPEFTPSSGDEIQSEYLVPREHAVNALRAVDSIREIIAPLLYVTEIRSVAADNLWMSPCYHQACVGIHFTWHKDWQSIRAILPIIEELLAPYNARPHWGKAFTMSSDQIQSLYPRLPDFRELLREYDPDGKFRNEFLEKYIFPRDQS